MTATPQSKLSSPFSIKNVHLKVANLENMSRFYQEEIGLELIKKKLNKLTLLQGTPKMLS